MSSARFVRLTPEEDARLRGVEQDPLLKPKARLRAQVLRLSGRGETVGGIASYTGRSEASVLRDLDRWEERRFEGLAEGTAPGNPPRINEEVRAFLGERLCEQRTWNATQLAEAVEERFGIGVSSGGGPPAPASDGLPLEAHPLRPIRRAGPRGGAASPGGTRRAKKGAEGGEHILKYLDESGFSLCLPPTTYTWTPVG